MLWEFWKRDYELFPPEILEDKAEINKKPHAIVFVFDGSNSELFSTIEEMQFYRSIVSMCKQRGYTHPFIIISKIDLFELRLRKEYAKQNLTEKQIEENLVKAKDKLIDSVSMKLKIHRNYIDFLENYSYEKNTKNMMINYYALVTFKKILDECYRYVEKETRSFCNIF